MVSPLNTHTRYQKRKRNKKKGGEEGTRGKPPFRITHLITPRPPNNPNSLTSLEDELAGAPAHRDAEDLGGDAQAEQRGLGDEGPPGPPQLDEVAGDEEVEDAAQARRHAQDAHLHRRPRADLASVAAVADPLEGGRVVVPVEYVAFHEPEYVDDAVML